MDKQTLEQVREALHDAYLAIDWLHGKYAVADVGVNAQMKLVAALQLLSAPQTAGTQTEAIRNAALEDAIHTLESHADESLEDIIAAMRKLQSSPSPSPAEEQDRIDAQRWRTATQFVGAMTAGGWRQIFHLQSLKPIDGANLFRGSVAQHFTEAVDAARAAQEGKK